MPQQEAPRTQREILDTLHIDPDSLQHRFSLADVTMRHVALTLTFFVLGCMVAFGYRSNKIVSEPFEVHYHYISGDASNIAVIPTLPASKTGIDFIAGEAKRLNVRYVIVTGTLTASTLQALCYSPNEGDGFKWILAAQPTYTYPHPSCTFGSDTLFSLIFLDAANSALASAVDGESRTKGLERQLARGTGPTRVLLSSAPYGSWANEVKTGTVFIGTSDDGKRVVMSTLHKNLGPRFSAPVLRLNMKQTEGNPVSEFGEFRLVSPS